MRLQRTLQLVLCHQRGDTPLYPPNKVHFRCVSQSYSQRRLLWARRVNCLIVRHFNDFPGCMNFTFARAPVTSPNRSDRSIDHVRSTLHGTVSRVHDFDSRLREPRSASMLACVCILRYRTSRDRRHQMHEEIGLTPQTLLFKAVPTCHHEPFRTILLFDTLSRRASIYRAHPQENRHFGHAILYQ